MGNTEVHLDRISTSEAAHHSGGAVTSVRAEVAAMKIFGSCSTIIPSHGPLQLRDQRDHGKDRVLRSGSLRKDDESSVHLRFVAVEQQEQDAFARDEDGPHALLRLP